MQKESTKVLLYLFKWKFSRLSEQKSNIYHQNKVMVPQLFPRLDPIYRLKTPQMEERQGPFEEGPHCIAKNLYC